jgi:hypothetical protein
LDATFERMQALAAEYGFQVTVLLAPTAERLYKDSFDDLPPISDEAHFIRYVQQLAGRHRFPVVDLHASLAPYAARELLYYRDDSHWNERGNRVVAEILAREAFVADAPASGHWDRGERSLLSARSSSRHDADVAHRDSAPHCSPRTLSRSRTGSGAPR